MAVMLRMAVVVVVVVAVGRHGQAFYLQRLGNFHELRELGMFDIHHALIHELQQLGHHGVRDVFEYDCRVENREYVSCRESGILIRMWNRNGRK